VDTGERSIHGPFSEKAKFFFIYVFRYAFAAETGQGQSEAPQSELV
jgi:hypothetical protein